MASRKQRRRRQKERRHEYEYVYVDDTGEEVEPPPGAEKSAPERPRGKSANGTKSDKGKKGTGPVRQARPPSWTRSIKRAALFLPLFFIVFSLLNKHSAIEVRFLSSLAYSALFVPLTYVMDRTAYRTYLRRSGQLPSSKR
ncbi:MAG TPA: hypothetical protein VKD88_05115 [Gaiellaceae bacterium]|nr:hypothetical protein [Gaiellaceae bacterium]